MTLTAIPRYDPKQITDRGGHAVVVGASVAGLVATRVLVDRFESVTLVDKDPLPEDAITRPGAPQAHHVHVMHRAGQATLEDLFPGYGEELIRDGALVIDLASDLEIYDEGDFLANGPTRLPMYCASRPVFEWVARRRVAALDCVTVQDECQFVDYLVDDHTSAVEGVTVRTADGKRDLPADLVVDATGRTSRTPAWLENHGYTPPTTDEVSIDLAYSTAVIERPPETRRTFLVLPNSPRTRGCGTFPIERGRWLVTLTGIHGDHPPTDPEGFADFAASLPIPDISELLDEHAMISEDIVHYPFPSNVRRRYEDLERFPDGLVVIGDAIASFNPIYGQGMSVAALEALQLHHALAADDDELALRFFERTERIVDDAWSLAVGSDFRFSQTTGPKPSGTDLLNKYLARLTRKAHTDGKLSEDFNRVVIMERPPSSLFRPRVVWRVLKPGL